MPVNHNQKVYISNSAKTNQYISAEIRVTDALLSHYPDLATCYRSLAQQVFELAHTLDLHHISLIANDKLPVVRFHTESYCFQTPEQILFFYNPAYHEAQHVFSDDAHRARKLRLVFLATGEEIRSRSAQFHQKVQDFLTQLRPLLPEAELSVKVRDHQHLSYDLFAQAKGNKESYGYKLRAIKDRYTARECPLPENHSSLSYVTIKVPLSRKLKQALISTDNPHDYALLYQTLEHAFVEAMTAKQLNRLAMVANGLTPLVRNSKFDKLDSTNELQMIGFDPKAQTQQFIRHWDSTKLVDTIHFTVVAGAQEGESTGYGRFMNLVESALKTFAATIHLDAQHDDLVVRFHQHISYQC